MYVIKYAIGSYELKSVKNCDLLIASKNLLKIPKMVMCDVTLYLLLPLAELNFGGFRHLKDI